MLLLVFLKRNSVERRQCGYLYSNEKPLIRPHYSKAAPTRTSNLVRVTTRVPQISVISVVLIRQYCQNSIN